MPSFIAYMVYQVENFRLFIYILFHLSTYCDILKEKIVGRMHMRLREIYIRCKKIYTKSFNGYIELVDKLDEFAKSIGYDRGVVNLQPDIETLLSTIRNEIRDIACFRYMVNRIDDSTFNPVSNAEGRLQLLGNLLNGMESIIQLYESMGLQSEEDLGLDIKLPKTDNITDFKKYVDGLEFVFTKCPFFQSDEASLKFNSVDVGSVWLIIGIACTSVAVGSILMNNIAAFIDKCIIIRSHKLTYKRQEQEIRRAELEQKEKEELLKNINKLYKIVVNNAINDLEESTGHKISDGDERGRVEQSFERLEKMIDEGLQIYASIDSPKEVQAVFAPLEMHYLSIGEELKRIEEATEKRTE